jgi:hypothetical protein
MSREEVQGLQALAKTHGTSLTINPDTGMPEAFKLGKFLAAVAPIAAGFMFPTFGTSWFGGNFLGQGIAAGALAGGISSALTGGNPLMGAITGGFGGYGGAGLANSAAEIAKANALKAGASTAEANLAATTASTTNPSLISTTSGGGYDPITGFGGGVKPDMSMVNTNLAAPNTSMFNTSTSANISNMVPSTSTNFKTLVSNPAQVAKNYGYGKTALLGASVANEAGAFDMDPIQNPKAQEYTKRVPTGQYDAQGNPIYTTIPQTAYSPNETLNLNNPYANYPNVNPGPGLQLPPTMIAKEGGEVHSYAIGGPVTTTGVQALYNSPDGTAAQNTPMDAYGIGRLNSLANAEAMNTAKTFGYANGGVIAFEEGGQAESNYRKDQTALNLDGIPSLNVKTGEQTLNSDNIQAYMNNFTPATLIRMLGRTDSPQLQLFSRLAPFAEKIPMHSTQMAKGGYLDGAGDGMSDSIPATIEGKQPARLADGEFVVPADVVSHIGNGSSKAGSKRLYAMLDKVRKARTGHTKQGKQINPNQYLPA